MAKARNLEFNEEGRSKAGLDEEFVRELQVYNRSTGRTPNIFFFNPDAENNIAGVANERESALQLAADLEILAAFISRRDDVVLVRELPSTEHLAHLSSLGFDLPEFEKIGADETIAADSLTRSRKLARLKPWAWCPKMVEMLTPLQKNLTVDTSIPWGEPLRDVFSKAWDSARLTELDCEDPGQVCTSIEEVEAAREKLGDPILIKAPFGASGQKNHRFDEGDPLTKWVGRTIGAQGCVIVESYFDRVFDFSAHYERDESGLRLLGFVRLKNTPRGQFLSATSGGKFGQNLPSELGRFLMGGARTPYKLYDEVVGPVLENALATVSYLGPIGVDAFVYRDETRELALRPIVEVNPRYTMGRVAHEIRRRLVPEQCARLRFHTKNQLKAMGFPDFSSYLSSPDSGVALNDPKTAQHVLAELTTMKSFPAGG